MVLATDGVSGSVKDIGGGQSACQLSVHGDVFCIDKVSDSNFGGDRLSSLVDPAVGRHVRMAVDQARADLELGTVDDFCTFWYWQIHTDSIDYPVSEDHVRIAKNAIGPAGPKRRILNDDQWISFRQGVASERSEWVSQARNDFGVPLGLLVLFGCIFSCIRFGGFGFVFAVRGGVVLFRFVFLGFVRFAGGANDLFGPVRPNDGAYEIGLRRTGLWQPRERELSYSRFLLAESLAG